MSIIRPARGAVGIIPTRLEVGAIIVVGDVLPLHRGIVVEMQVVGGEVNVKDPTRGVFSEFPPSLTKYPSAREAEG